MYGIKSILKSSSCGIGSERTDDVTADSSSYDDKKEERDGIIYLTGVDAGDDEESKLIRRPQQATTSNNATAIVSFSTVEIRSYVIQLGDSPYSEGAPICLSNERALDHDLITDAIQFDDMRKQDRRRNIITASSRNCLYLSPTQRSHLYVYSWF